MILSIGIPNYNGGKNLVRAVKSCMNLGMKPDDFEVLVVDNRSTDDSLDLIKDLQTKYSNIRLVINDKNYGRVGNWNRVLEEASGEYIVFLFSNDSFTSSANLMGTISLMKEEKIYISKSRRILLSDYSSTTPYKNKNSIIKLKTFIGRNISLLSSLPFGPTQSFIFDAGFIKTHHIVFNTDNEISADHQFGLDIYGVDTKQKILISSSYNILFDDSNKDRLHTKLSYFDMHGSEFSLLFEKKYQDILGFSSRYLLKKYMTRISYIQILHFISAGNMFPNFQKSDSKKLMNLYSTTTKYGKIQIGIFKLLSYFDSRAIVGFILFILNKGNSI